LANVQNKLRSKATVDPSGVRQHYVPALTCNLFTDIQNVSRRYIKGEDQTDFIFFLSLHQGDYDKAMDTMDFYYLDRENLETLSDLGLTSQPAMKSLNAATKRNFNKA
jgi:replication factor C subunit 1